jgi:hypothetical protein
LAWHGLAMTTACTVIRPRRSRSVSCPMSGPFSARIIRCGRSPHPVGKDLGLHGTPLADWVVTVVYAGQVLAAWSFSWELVIALIAC